MRIKRAAMVPDDEMEYMRDHGILDMAERRTRAIRRQHLRGDSRISAIARDCYLQGIRDAAQATDG